MVDHEAGATEDAREDGSEEEDRLGLADDPGPVERVNAGRPADLDTLGAYLLGVGRHQLITGEREVELAQTIEAGERAAERMQASKMRNPRERRNDERLRRQGLAAREQMIHANLRLVVAEARRYRWAGVPLLDLIQEGNIGLMRGVEKFDWRRGLKFSTYATWWIRQAIQRGIADRGRVIRLPVHVHDLLLQLGRARVALEAELGRDPTDAEVAASMWIPLNRVRELRGIASHVLSLETPVAREREATVGEFVPDEAAGARYEEVLAKIGRDEALKVLATLNHRERTIIALRFGLTGEEPLTLAEIGKIFNLTRERIRQLEAQALAKLRHPSRSAALRVEG